MTIVPEGKVGQIDNSHERVTRARDPEFQQ